MRTHTCFVVMPFGDTEHGQDPPTKIKQAAWTHIFESWIKPAVESYPHEKFQCKRSPAKPGNFIKGIVKDLQAADLVIADLTGSRPNVYYELGIRHALKVGTIILTQDLGSVPSDLRAYHAAQYEYSPIAHEHELFFGKFKQTIHSLIDQCRNSEDPCDSPVSDFLDILDQVAEKTLEQEKEDLLAMLTRLRTCMHHNFSVCETLAEAVAADTPPKGKGFLILHVFPLEVVFTQIATYRWSSLRAAKLERLEELILNCHMRVNELKELFAALTINPEPHPVLSESFNVLLQGLSKERKVFDKMWESLVAGLKAAKLVRKLDE